MATAVIVVAAAASAATGFAHTCAGVTPFLFVTSCAQHIILPCRADWQCKTVNFARRQACFKCKDPRGPDALPAPSYREGDRYAASSSSTLVLRDLNMMTTEETLYTSLGVHGQLKEIRLLRDNVTQMSKCDAPPACTPCLPLRSVR